MTGIRILRAGPLATLQDTGRPGLLRYGIAASGPMDGTAFRRAGDWLGGAGSTGIEFTTAGLSLAVDDAPLGIAWDGGQLTASIDGKSVLWPGRAVLKPGSVLDITPGASGNYGYLRFDRELDVPPVLGSRATSSIAGLGGLEGRALRAGDTIPLGIAVSKVRSAHPRPSDPVDGPMRIVWGLHADTFAPETRAAFLAATFTVTPALNRMGVRLTDTAKVFGNRTILSLVSDAVVPGDIQILGDSTPIVLMRDHQPTGGYPRIATIVSADLDRFAQLRPGSPVRFQPIRVT